jgi:hypothetical protein
MFSAALTKLSCCLIISWFTNFPHFAYKVLELLFEVCFFSILRIIYGIIMKRGDKHIQIFR